MPVSALMNGTTRLPFWPLIFRKNWQTCLIAYRFYRLHPEPLQDVLAWSSEFAAFFEQRLDALGEYLDRKHGKPARGSKNA